MKRPSSKPLSSRKQVAPRGATQKSGPRTWSPKLLKALRIGVWSLVFVGLVVTAYLFAAEPLERALNRPIASVKVEGEFRYLEKQKAADLISATLEEDFLELDLQRVKSVLEREPWIEKVSVQRQWPDILRVRVYEQQPIARWGKSGFLNQKGAIIRVADADKLNDLPWLDADDDQAAKVMRQYQDIAPLMRARGLTLKTLKCDQRKSWKMQLQDDIEVTIGRDQVMEKIGRFVSIYDRYLQDNWSDVASVDLRYDSGIAVAWVGEANAEQKEAVQ